MVEKMENMKGDRELEKLLSEIPNPQYHHHRLGSSSYMSCGGDGGSSYLDDADRFYWPSNNGGRVAVDELGLTSDFQKINLGDMNNNGLTNSNARRFVVEAAEGGFRTTRTHPSAPDPTITTRCVLSNNNNNKIAASCVNVNVVGVDPLMESSSYFDYPSNNGNSYYYSSYYPTKHDHYLRSNAASPYHRACSPFSDHHHPLKPCKADPIYNSHKPNSDLVHPKHGFTVENASGLYSPPLPHFMSRMRAEEPLAMAMGQSVVLMKTAKKMDGPNLEDTYVLEERPTVYDPSSRVKVRNCHSGIPPQFFGDNNNSNKSLEFNSFVNCHPIVVQSTGFNSVSDVQGNIYLIAKDQHGCRFLQKKFEEGSYEDVELIFNEIIDCIVELMMNPFGNYLIQKLLDVCHEGQRMRIVHTVTREPGQLVRISLNTHGTRVVQKLIETLRTQEQISLVVLALEPGFLDLIKDLNGNHVIQRCLQCLSTVDNKFIFDAAAKYSVDIATHRHGCCVLQRCIDHSNGEQRQKLIAEICANGLLLAQDPFGNYVVQYILEKKIPSASAQLVTQFEDHFVHLSMQKFSSHVVEKCLKFYEESRPVIVHELLSVSHFEQVLQDQYANYVIQSALDVTKGPLHDSLVAAVRPHTILRTNPYCKKIFSRGLLKK